MTALRKIPDEMTLAEFLEWDAPGPQRWQLVAGVPEAMAPAAETHGRIQSRLSAMIERHFEETQSPCRIVTAPGIVPKTDDSNNYRIPDLAVTCAPPKPGRLYLEDSPLIVEILSPSNQKETWLNVSTYTTIASVKDILIIESTHIGAEVWRCAPGNVWLRKQFGSGEDIIELPSVDFSFVLFEAYRGTGLV
jgi:Uma2 family endonuclease